MKNELLKDSHFTSIQQVRAAVDAAVLFYNDERPHMSIGMQTPSQAALLTGERQKHWISYRERYIKSSLGLV
jgi:transposase InsO family protein